jgi:hypothetical protein
MRSPYVILYRGAFSFPLSPCDMWNELERPDRLARGRRWVEVRQVDPRGLQPGAALLCVVEPPLPYRMSLEVVVVEASRCEFVEVEIHGDLEGHAELRPDDVVVARFVWATRSSTTRLPKKSVPPMSRARCPPRSPGPPIVALEFRDIRAT